MSSVRADYVPALCYWEGAVCSLNCAEVVSTCLAQTSHFSIGTQNKITSNQKIICQAIRIRPYQFRGCLDVEFPNRRLSYTCETVLKLACDGIIHEATSASMIFAEEHRGPLWDGISEYINELTLRSAFEVC